MSEVSSISPRDTCWSHVVHSSGSDSSDPSWVLGVSVIVVRGDCASHVESSWSGVVPRMKSSSISFDIWLEWLITSTVLIVSPVGVEVSKWSNGLVSSVNLSVLQLLHLMLSVWDINMSFPNWIINCRSCLWSWWSSHWIHYWGISCNMRSLASSNNSITQIIFQWNDLRWII